MKIILDRRVSENRWRCAPEGALLLDSTAPLPDALIVALADWRLHGRELLRRGVSLGVRLGPGDDVEELAADLGSIELVALEFGSFTEGRPYTQARLLRERYGYRGEIRAVGDVSRDRIAFMERCGINAYQLPGDADLGAILDVFDEISDVYQPAADGRPVIASRRA